MTQRRVAVVVALFALVAPVAATGAAFAADGVVVARSDYAAAAAKSGLTLRPSERLIFGNPKRGTPLLQVQQTAVLDLPLNMLAWQDEADKVRILYNAPRWLGTRLGPGGAESARLYALGKKRAAMAATEGSAT